MRRSVSLKKSPMRLRSSRLVRAGPSGPAGARVLIVWLYNNTGRSVFAAALFHMTINVAWQLFPIHGSYFDPRSSGVITAVIAVIIASVWGFRNLARPPT